MGQLLKAQKYTFLYLLALNTKIKPEKQDKNNLIFFYFFYGFIYFF